MKAHEEFLAWPLLKDKLQELESLLASNDVEGTKALLVELVSGYTPQDQGLDAASPARRLRYCV